MHGLILYAETSTELAETIALLDRLEIPLGGFRTAASRLFADVDSLQSFLFASVRALLTPGETIPAALLLKYLSGDAYPGNVLRRYVFLQLSLLPYLRVHEQITELSGAHLLGSDLLVLHYNAEGGSDCLLPEGVWCDLYTGERHEHRIRQLQSINQPPVLVRAGALLPIGMNDRTANANDADRVTLHWYEPAEEAGCKLLSGETYRAWVKADGSFCAEADTAFAWHLVVHRDGMDLMVR